MSSSNSITVRGALNSAGAEVVRSMQLPSGIILSEWTGQNTLTEYKSSSENVLSVYLSGGENCAQVDGRHIVRRGFKSAVCLFPVGEGESQWRITERLNFLHIYFDLPNLEPSLIRSLRQPAEASRFREVFQEASPVISAAATSIAQADWNDDTLSLGIDSLMSWILLNAISRYAMADLERVDARGRLSAKQAEQIREYCNANLGEAVRLEHLADLVNLSRYHFLRKFKNTFDRSPHAFLTELRMLRAHDLLKHTDHKIMSIALECGYAQHSRFSTAFKRHYGYSPGAVRGK
ncbi:TPA: helix-turn-helix transcriptional regulator [Burkholderia vietnamiensis]|uniref:helix-turn-helix transcriptional regulator n=1 Tax=Burkholderia vietnamiensis TaxID=60552 RepID=UPI0015944D9A|nr:helix-turn-helix transcriptional regulator [Burkholderia vietnamiensis]HDR9011902.1 helix-turn-helix transcriptional regulator [Burkholderia vietnamiensis]HDR9014364.1 helix-turn-helix transcriptional regulator [Burkholderia vietnamiensis]